MYKYYVGKRPLNIPMTGWSTKKLDEKDMVHMCLLLDNDIFEYDREGYHRRINQGKISEFDWNSIGIDGWCNISPSKLQEIIEDFNRNERTYTYLGNDFPGDVCEYGEGWKSKNYKFGIHCCQHFVQFCLDKIGNGDKLDSNWLKKHPDHDFNTYYDKPNKNQVCCLII